MLKIRVKIVFYSFRILINFYLIICKYLVNYLTNNSQSNKIFK